MTQVTLKPSTSEDTISDYLNKQSQKTLLKFLTCGSVDDGKSTLIGRLLFETGSVPDSELKTLEADSQKFGTTGDQYDFALLVDGLSSEREQGITIDVAYRYFATSKRKFIVADTPGHEQYTRNMATGASNCDVAVIMLDASKGLLTQTRRHSFIASLLGIKHVIVAVNKMDLIDFSQEKYLALCDDYHNFAQTLGFESLSLIPISAMNGDNITSVSPNMPWYKGPMLLETLEKVEPQQKKPEPFAMSVQMVSRPDRTFRGYAGRINSGVVCPGDSIRVAPSGKVSTIKEIVTFDGKKKQAVAGESVTLTLTDEVDISRGNVLTAQQSPCEVANQFQTTLLWMSEKSLVVSRQYILQLANQSVIATPVKLKHRIDIATLKNSSADKLQQNEFGVCELSVNKPLSFKTYQQCKSLGGFILIDRLSNETVACGFIDFALRRSGNIYHHAETITPVERSAIKAHVAKVIWLTGLSGAGKSTIANILEQKLNQQGVHTMLLDGDNVRHGLNKNLGFTKTDRAENIRRIAEVAKLMTQAGLVTIVSFISPFKAERQMARELIGEECFTEVFVDVSLAEAKKRDPKGLYKKALSGEIKNFTGLDSPYEKPTSANLIIDTESVSAEAAADKVMRKIKL